MRLDEKPNLNCMDYDVFLFLSLSLSISISLSFYLYLSPFDPGRRARQDKCRSSGLRFSCVTAVGFTGHLIV